MPRKLETRAFIINCLKAIAKNAKVHSALRLRAIDRISVMEKFYPIEMVNDVNKNPSRDAQFVKTELDDRVEKMLKQLGGDDAKLS